MNLVPSDLVKVIELIFTIVCIAIHVHTLPEGASRNYIHFVVYGAYLIIIPVMLLGAVSERRMPHLLDAVFLVIGGALFIASGCVSIEFFHNWKKYHPKSKKPAHGMIEGMCSITTGIIMLADTALYATFTFLNN